MSKISERAMAQPQQSPQYRSRIVEDDALAKALEFLRESASEIGKARARLIRAERMVEHTEALLIKMSNASSDQKRKADARTDERWIAATQEEAEAAGEWEKMKALREAAAAKIEAWRSEQANFRGMKA